MSDKLPIVLTDEITPPAGADPGRYGRPTSSILSRGERADRRFIEFFTANIRNRNTRMAYARGKATRPRPRSLNWTTSNPLPWRLTSSSSAPGWPSRQSAATRSLHDAIETARRRQGLDVLVLRWHLFVKLHFVRQPDGHVAVLPVEHLGFRRAVDKKYGLAVHVHRRNPQPGRFPQLAFVVVLLGRHHEIGQAVQIENPMREAVAAQGRDPFRVDYVSVAQLPVTGPRPRPSGKRPRRLIIRGADV